MVAEDLYFGGEKFIPVRRAAEKTKYSIDYVGQLCRSGKIVGKRVGRMWYVSDRSLDDHLASNSFSKGSAYRRGDARLISIKEAAVLSKYSTDYVGELCRKGKIDGKQVGRAWYVEEGSLRAHVEQNLAAKGGAKRHAVAKKDIPKEKVALGQALDAESIRSHVGEFVKEELELVRTREREREANLAIPLFPPLKKKTETPVAPAADAVPVAPAAPSAPLRRPRSARFALASAAPAFALFFLCAGIVAGMTRFAPSLPLSLAEATHRNEAALADLPVFQAYSKSEGGKLLNSIASSTRSLIRSAGDRLADALFGDIDYAVVVTVPESDSVARLVEELTKLRREVATTRSAPPATGGAPTTRIIERVTGSDITKADLSILENKLKSEIYRMADLFSRKDVAIDRNVSHTNRIDDLYNVGLHGATIDGASSFTGTTLTVSGAGTFNSTLAVSGAATFSSTLAVTGLSTFSGGILSTASSTITDLTVVNSTTTNATSTEFFATNLYTPNLMATTSATLGTTTITNLSVTNTSTSTFAGGLAIGGSQFVIQQATGRVGIGTTDPAYQLQVGGGAFLDGRVNLLGSQPLLRIEDTDSTGPFATNWILQAYNGRLRLLGGTVGEILSIASSTGYVGIGTTSPSAALSLGGNFMLTGTSTFTGTDSGITFTGTGVHDITAAAGTLRIGSNTIIGNIQALDDTVDIGTPATRFDKIYANEVNATTLVGTLTGGNLTAETFTINSDNATADAEDAFLAFERGTVSPNALLTWNSSEAAKRFELNQPLYIENASASTTLTTLDLKSVAGQIAHIFRVSSSSGTNLFNVAASGNLGIGSTTPWGLLSVNPNGISGPAFVIGSSTATKLIVTNGGNVGIGTSTPAKELTLYNGTFRNGLSSLSASDQWVDQSITDGGGFPVLNFNRGNAGVVFFDTVANFSFLKTVAVTGSVLVGGATPTVGVNGVGTLTVQSGGANPVVFKTNSAEVARFDSAGNLGIGSTTPWGLLSVNPNGISGPAFVIGSSTATKLIVTNGGNVGIGTTSPTATLAISGANDTAPFVVRHNAVGNNQLNLLDIQTNGTSVLSLDNRGSLTYDATNAMGQQGQLTLNVRTSSDDARTAFTVNATNSNNSGGTLQSLFRVQNFGSTKFHIDTAGNVGIGTTSPMAKFAVAGGNAYLDGLNSVALTLNKQSAVFESSINFAQLGTAIATIQHTTSGNFVISGPNSATTQVLAGNGGTLALSAAASGVMTMSTNNIEAARITSGGLFGVGTSTPWGQLSASSTGTYPALAIEQKSTGPAAVFLGGNVGIGTTSPYAPLSVSTSVANGLVLSGPSVRPYMSFEFPQQGNRWGLGSPEDSSNAFALRDLDGSRTPFYVEDLGGDTGTNALRITCGTSCGTFSKIGIATTAPSARLSVKGGGTGTGRAFAVSDSANAEKFSILDNGTVGISGANVANATAGGQLQVMTTDAAAADIGGSIGLGGYFGPGQTNPYVFAQIAGRQNTVGGGSSQRGYLSFSVSGQLPSGGGTIFQEGIRIDYNGEVGIGTSTPSAKLAVNPLAGDRNQFIIGSSTATSFIINPAGNVGIGSTSPTNLFQVAAPVGPITFSNMTGFSTAKASIHAGSLFISTNAQNAAGVNVDALDLTLNVNGAHSAGSQNLNFRKYDSGNNVNRGLVAQITGGTATGITGNGSGFLALSVATTSATTPTEALRIISNLNVGIGTTSPYTALAVAGSTGVLANVFTATSSTATSTFAGGIGIGTVSPKGTGQRVVEIAGVGGSANQYGSLSLSNASNSGNNFAGALDYYVSNQLIASIRAQVPTQPRGTLLFYTADGAGTLNETASLSTAGLFKIGSSTESDNAGTPATRLVLSNAVFGQTKRLLNLTNGQTGDNSNTEIGFGSISSTGTNIDVAAIRAIKSDSTNGAEVGQLAFYTRNSGTLQESIRFAGNGNLGIGTTSPYTKFAVADGAGTLAFQNASQANLYVSGTNATINIDSTGGSSFPGIFIKRAGSTDGQITNISGGAGLALYGNGSALGGIYLASDGNVGVGTTTPGRLFSVHGDALVSGTLYTGGITATGTMAFGTTTVTNLAVTNTSTSTFAGGISVAGSSGLTVMGATGRVMIGTNTDINQGNLYVVGGARVEGTFKTINLTEYVGGASIQSDAALSWRYLGDLSFNDPNNTNVMRLGTNNVLMTYASTTAISSSGSAYFATSSGSAVGIGTTSPWGKLSVTNTGTGPSFIVEDSTSPDTTPFIVDASGNVGIGAPTPYEKLHLTVSDETFMIGTTDFDNATAGSRVFMNLGATTGDTYGVIQVQDLGGTSNNDLVLQRFGGNVGIGTTTPTNKLSITGNFQQYIDNSTNYRTSQRATGIIGLLGTGDYFLNYDTANLRVKIGGGAANAGASTFSVYGNAAIGTGYESVAAPTNGLIVQGNVGIGTTTPLAKLSVHANNGDTNTTLFAVASSTASATTTHFVVTNAGNIGIGTAAPGTAKLALQAAPASNIVDISLRNGDGTETGNLGINSGGQLTLTSPLSEMFIRAGVNLFLQTNGANTRMSLDVNGNVSIPTAAATTSIAGGLTVGTTNLVVDRNSGNVGIGTTTPGGKLHITTSGVADNIVLDTTGSGIAGFSFKTLSAVKGYFAVATAANHFFSGAVAGDLSYRVESGGRILFGVDNGAGTASPTLTISSGSNVGIGTTSPVAKLDVNGNVLVNGAQPSSVRQLSISNGIASVAAMSYQIAGVEKWITYSDAATLGFGIQQAGIGDRLSINSAGNVGVGTTTPIAKLTVNNTGSGASFMVSDEADPDTTPGLYVDASGNVAIGQTFTSGGEILSVAGIMAINQIRTRDNPLQLYSISGATNEIQIGDSGDLVSIGGAQSATARLSILASGNIGIGSTTPWGLLSVNPNGISGPAFVVGSSTATKLIVTNGGNVGIGTTSPTKKFSVADGSQSLTFEEESGITSVLTQNGSSFAEYRNKVGTMEMRIGGSASYGYLQTFSNHPLTFWTNGANERMRITEAGNVGIGTTSPAYKLDVGGFVNVDPFSGYKQNGTTILYASTTFSSLAVGPGAGTSGFGNTAVGSNSMTNNTTGQFNTAVGSNSMTNNTTGEFNTAAGALSLDQNTTGSMNTGFGLHVLSTNKTGGNNTGIGSSALRNNVSATNTVAVGYSAALGPGSYSNQGGTYVGYQAGLNAQTGSDYNALVGYQAGYDITTGANNTILGQFVTTGSGITTGSGNILIGNGVRAGLSQTGSNQLNIGNLIFGTSVGSDGTLSTGNVGIGTTSPYAKLSVHANNGETNTTLFAVASSTASATTTHFVVNNIGQVGIGTTTLSDSTAALTIDSFTAVQNIVGGFTSRVDIRGKTDGVSPSLGLFHDTNGFRRDGYYMKLSETGSNLNKLQFVSRVNNGDTTRLTLDTTGNVGIGTTTPPRRLSVQSSAANTRPMAIYSSTGLPLFDFINNGSTGDAILDLASSTESGTINTAVIRLNTNGDSWFNGGNLGIRTASPISPYGLSINNRNSTDDGLRIDLQASNNILVAVSGGNTSHNIYSSGDAGRMQFFSGGSVTTEIRSDAATYFNGGSVGIGTTTPVSTLSVQGSLCVRDTGSCGTTAGTIYATNAAVQDIDLAENYPTSDPTLEAGEIVAVGDEPESVKRAQMSDIVIGVVSTKPGLLLGREAADARPVALAGRIPVKVSTEGGAIRKGDRIVLSSIPGIGMKATTSGMTVGIALGNFDGAADSSTYDASQGTVSVNGISYAKGSIVVFVNLSYQKLDSDVLAVRQASTSPWFVDETGGIASVIFEANVSLRGHALLDVARIASASGLWSIDEGGKLIAQEIETKKLKVDAGVTTKDRATGEFHCLFIANGSITAEPGECGTSVATAGAPAPEPAATSTEPGTGVAVTEPAPEPIPTDPVATSTPATTEPTLVQEEPVIEAVQASAPATEPVTEPAPEPAPVVEPAPAPTEPAAVTP